MCLTFLVGWLPTNFQLKTLLQAGSDQNHCGGWWEWDGTSAGVGGNS